MKWAKGIDACPTLAITYSELANEYNELGNTKLSIQYLNLAEKGLNKLHWSVTCPVEKGYRNIAYVFFRLGNYSASLKYSHTALTIIRKNLGEESAALSGVYEFIGDSYFSMGYSEQAIENYYNAREILQTSWKKLFNMLDKKIILVKIQGGQIEEAEKLISKNKEASPRDLAVLYF